MVKNKGGNKTKRVARKQLQNEAQKRSLNELMKTEGQEYAVVRRINGGGRFNLICADKIERIGVARPTLKRNKKFIEVNQMILVSLRDFQENTCDILDVYTGAEVEYLVKAKLLDEEFVKKNMGHKDVDGNVVDRELDGFAIRHNDDDSDDSDDDNDQKTSSAGKKSSIDDIWDEI
jgi:translation initiation factor 1A